jgi:hypothetical protein
MSISIVGSRAPELERALLGRLAIRDAAEQLATQSHQLDEFGVLRDGTPAQGQSRFPSLDLRLKVRDRESARGRLEVRP